MPERDKEELAKLKFDLAQDKLQQENKNNLVENIRKQLEKIARESVEKYHREVELIQPEAQKAIDQVIQPWFSDLISSGVYEELLRWCRTHKEEINLSEKISYYWPEDALKPIAKNEKKLYLDTAKFVAEHYKDQDLERGIQRHTDGDELWYSGFKIYHSGWNKSEGIRIWRQPIVGMGFGFAMIARTYDILINPDNIFVSLKEISPAVWIKFSQQIESGKIWEIINGSLSPILLL
ncbi:MAG: hypothetical protein V1808_01390 [Candidatus Daviesbacteria bacterium]